MSSVSTAQLPHLYLVVWPVGCTFSVEQRLKHIVQRRHWCKTFDELVQVINDLQLWAYVQKDELPAYLLHDTTQCYEPLSYERAHQLAQEAE